MRAKLAIAAMTFALAGATGCSNCNDEIEEGQSFLNDPQHLACESDDDCVVQSTGCHTFERGFCQQVQLNRTAVATKQWQGLKADLETCENECTVCAGAMLPSCSDGLCGGAR